ncbi:DUF2846 domain-containing protein [Burkholderia sp. Bp8963]|uniref:DUF2846 domain-containing protein n=1 Tax=Burkholderia sp. Bp8963 TaxID=2184547 RepID=UPI00267EA98B|nr:DUF2846 domain-containing protein [Burkholderia sp. Bp8963]
MLLAACATGPTYRDIAASIPTLDASHGRIYFLRSASVFGAAIQPEIRINRQVVGHSQPGGFFYVDEAPGTYTVTTSTEVEREITFDLAAGQTRYVRTAVGFGVLVGHVTPSLVWPDSAQAEIQTLSYTGGATPSPSLAAPPAKPAYTAATSAASALAGSELKRVATTRGNEVKLSWHATWNKQCVAGKAPDLTFTRQPEHGRVEVREESFPLSNTSSMAAPCDGTTVLGKVVYYIPNADYHGYDEVDYHIASRYRTYDRAVSIEIR